MTESEKTTVWVSIPYKKKLKQLALDNDSTIEIEIAKILKKEFSKTEE